MSFKGPFQNPYQQTGVILAPVSDNIQTDFNLEPPFVRMRQGNNSFVYIDSVNSTGTPVNFTVGTNNASLIFAARIKRFAISALRMAYNVPNVNPYNNQININLVDTAGPTTYILNAVMPTGYYTTVTAFVTAFINTIQAARATAGASGTFTASVNATIDPQVYTIDAGAGYTFSFNSCTMLNRGRFLCNLPTDLTLTQTKQMGAIMLMYTRYIDICSKSFNDYVKNPSTADGIAKPHLLFRLYDTPNSVDGNGNFTSFSRDRYISRDNLSWVNYERDTSVSAADIILYDEFGNQLYINTYADRPSDFFVDIEIVTEL